MNTSLRDQLLAAGLVSKKQAQTASHQEQQRQFRKQPKPNAAQSVAVQQAQVAKTARDQELNRRREDKAQRRARIAEIERLIEQNRVPRIESDDHYSFIDGKKIRRMSVDAPRRAKITSGELVIVRYKAHYAVVPAETAARIRERDQNMVVPYVAPKETTDQDDPYKSFVVPDDLMW